MSETTSHDEYPPGHQIGDFEIERVAGRGAMGIVYRAAQISLGRVVALKVIGESLVGDPAFRTRFEREARAAAALGHPNIVSVHEAGQVDGVLYIAMQWVDGGDLRQHIAKNGPLPANVAARIVTQIADALDAAHATHVLHRDVKPANILVLQMAAGLHAYLTDFGITRPFVHLRNADGLTESGYVVGTPGFLSPEQIEGRDIDGRADLYALGCVLFETLTGKPPFQRATNVATLLAHTTAPRPLVSETNPNVGTAFDEVVRKALAIDPAGRYADGASLAAAVEEAARRGSRLPPVRRVPKLPTVNLTTQQPLPTPPSRLVVKVDDDDIATDDDFPQADAPLPPIAAPPPPPPPLPPQVAETAWTQAVQQPPPAPARAPRPDDGQRRARRGRNNATALLAAGALVLGAVVAALLSGKEAAPDKTTGFVATGVSQATTATGSEPLRRNGERADLVILLRRFAEGFEARDVQAIRPTLALTIRRRGRDVDGVCRVTTTRRAALKAYGQLPQIKGFRLTGLRLDDVIAPTGRTARHRARAETTELSGAVTRETVKFSFKEFGDQWRIVGIEACDG